MYKKNQLELKLFYVTRFRFSTMSLHSRSDNDNNNIYNKCFDMAMIYDFYRFYRYTRDRIKQKQNYGLILSCRDKNQETETLAFARVRRKSTVNL